jgi:hypothetical protein
MIVRKPDRSFCMSTWPPCTWFPPSMHGCMYCRYGTQFSPQVPEACFVPGYSTHYLKGAIV